METVHEIMKLDDVDDGTLTGDQEVKISQSTSVVNTRLQSLVSAAKASTHVEHHMTIREAIKLYPKAIIFSIILSTAVIMEGYDVVLLSNLYAFPPFQRRYGSPVDPGNPNTNYQISAAWQAGLSNGAAVGEIFGLAINGVVSERYGYRWTMIASLTALTCFIFIPFFARNLAWLQAGEILCGIPWGVFQTLTTAYASEVCPTQLRAYLTTYVNICWGVGQLIAQGVLRSMLSRNDEWAYRIPFAIQWIWPIPLIIGVLLAPESPWWYIRHGRIEDAKRALRALTSPQATSETSFNIDDTIAMMIHTTELEKAAAGATSSTNKEATYWECFKGTDLRRTEIVCMIWAIQNGTGAAFMGYATYFYEQAGLPTVDAFDMAMALYALAILGVFGSWYFMANFGRRTIYIWGLASLTVVLFLIGFISLNDSIGASWAIGSMLLVYTFIYDLSIGSVCYSLVAELPSVRLKTKTIVLARICYNLVGIVNAVVTPYMLNPTAWNWKGKTGFFWGAWAFLSTLYCWWRLPEPKGRTYGELDGLFERGVVVRGFSHGEPEDEERVGIFGMDSVPRKDEQRKERENK